MVSTGPQLQQSQSQQLVMTPQLQQAIKLLQMSSQELASYVAAELEANPLLSAPDGTQEGESAETTPTTSDTPEALNGAMEFESDSLNDPDQPWEQDSAHLSAPAPRLDDDEFDGLANLSDAPNLRDFLRQQIEVDFLEPAQKLIAVALLDLLDEAGYLPADLALVQAQLGASDELFLGTIRAFQQLEPAGIGARNLAECLALQLAERNRLDPAMETMLAHLPLVATRELAKLSKLCGVDGDDIRDMIAELKQLNPKPAAAFQHSIASTLIPDVLVRPIPGGSWHLELNNAALPRVLANEKYYTTVNASAKSKTDKSYVSERWQQANWLVKALAQRADSIMKVATEIVARQDAFLVGGVAHLKPMVLREVAAATGLHESTVSRVTTQKYLATPRGVFELKYFFTNAVGEGDSAVSAEAIKHRLKQLIEGEGHKILSDDALTEKLNTEGFNLARRTVAKYREALGLPTSAIRKRQLRG